jgi:hypothetical protein
VTPGLRAFGSVWFGDIPMRIVCRLQGVERDALFDSLDAIHPQQVGSVSRGIDQENQEHSLVFSAFDDYAMPDFRSARQC